MSSPDHIGKYQLLRKLAVGGMAEVYLARVAGPMGFQKLVVLKSILPHLAEDPGFVAMFMGEARLAAQLNHPGLVQVFDFGEAQGTWMLTMEFVDGPNLRALIRRATEQGEPIKEAYAARIVAMACEALAYAHEFVDPTTGQAVDLVHRDVSPDNVMLTRSGVVKVVDFGVAKAANQLHRTRPGTIKGKFSYMSPEHLTGAPLDRRADVFALGVVLFELLTGRRPFEATHDADVANAILKHAPASLKVHRRDASPELQRILDHALEKKREDRYSSCRALQTDLERFISASGENVTSQHLAQWVQRLIPPEGARATMDGEESLPAGPNDPTRSHEGPAPQPRSRPDDPTRSDHGPARRVLGHNDPTPMLPNPRPNQPPTQGVFTGALIDVVSDRRLRRVIAGAFLLGAGGLTAMAWWQSRAPKPVDLEPVVEIPEHEGQRQQAAHDAGAEPDAGTPVALTAVEPPAHVPQPAPVKTELPRPKPRPPPPKPQPGGEPAKPAATATGLVEFRVRPYANVYVNGTSLGVTPFKPVELPLGNIEVRLLNETVGFDKTVTWEVKPGSTVFKYNHFP